MPPAPLGTVRPPVPPLHVIAADEVLLRPDFARTAAAMLERHGAGIALHLRGHGMDGGALFHLAAALAPVAERTGGLLIVNDRVDVALCAGAGGVQLGARSLPVAVVRAVTGEARLPVDAADPPSTADRDDAGARAGEPGGGAGAASPASRDDAAGPQRALRLGYSAHAVEEAAAAERAGVDWVLAGTIFETASHPGRPGAGAALVRAMAERASAPIIAIGGIAPERVAAVVAAGAAGVAVLGGIWRAGDAMEALERYRAALDGGSAERIEAARMDTITVTINGAAREIAAGQDVHRLLEALGLRPGLVVVEHNREILERGRLGDVEVKAGDNLEIVHFVGGG